MPRYKFNPDTDKVHNIANRTGSCNFGIMDGDETNFSANNDFDAIFKAKIRFTQNASGCQHCMSY